MLAYPEHRKRGRYLAIWLTSKNSGQIIGGAINQGLNTKQSRGGKVSYATLLAFVVMQVLPLPAAFLVSHPDDVQREDGTKVKVDSKTTVQEPFRLMWKIVSTQRMGMSLPIFSSVLRAGFGAAN